MRIKTKKRCSFPGCIIFVESRKQRCEQHATKSDGWQMAYRKRQKLKQNK